MIKPILCQAFTIFYPVPVLVFSPFQQTDLFSFGPAWPEWIQFFVKALSGILEIS